MIQQQHLVAWPTVERTGKNKVTQPNMAVTISEAVKNMNLGSPEEQAGAYYDQIGMPIPDFNMMSKTDRMIALNKYREDVKIHEGKLAKTESVLAKKEKEAIMQKTIKAEVDAKQSDKPTGDAGSKGTATKS